MYKLVILTALFGLSLAAIGHGNRNQISSLGHHQQQQQHHHHSAPSSDDVHAETRSFHSDVRADGFDYALDTTNGIHVAQSGDVNGNVHGDYGYTSPEGVPVNVVYVADENGYQPQSDLLPTPPPIPDYILRALEYIRTHPHAEERVGGSHNNNDYHAPAAQQHHSSQHRASSAFGRHH